MLWIVLGIILDIWGVLCLFNTIKFFQTSMANVMVLIVVGVLAISLSILCFKKYKKGKDQPQEIKNIKQNKEKVLTENNLKNVKKKNGCVISFLLVLLLFGGAFIFSIIQVSHKIVNSPSTKITSTELLQSVIEVTEEQAKTIEDILSQCEVNDISEVAYKTDFDEDSVKFYDIRFKNTMNFTNSKVVLGISDNIVKEIYYIDYKLYGDGQIINKLSDFILSTEEKSDLHYRCEKTIETILISPSTAKFASIVDWKFKKHIKTQMAQGHVDSQNAFGAMIRSKFQLTFEDDSLTSLIFDGKEYIEQE